MPAALFLGLKRNHRHRTSDAVQHRPLFQFARLLPRVARHPERVPARRENRLPLELKRNSGTGGRTVVPITGL